MCGASYCQGEALTCDVFACASSQGAKKKRISALRRYPTSIACLAFSPNGERLAIAASYTYERGEMAHTPPDAIYLHTTSPEQFAPKR